MPKTALTATAVERIKPPTTGQVEHFDKGFPGLALRVSYGGGKSWVFFYRIDGRLRRMSLGTYPVMSLAEAREAWRDARQAVAKGVDPARPSQDASLRFTVVVAEWLKRDQSRNKASSFYQVKRIVEHDLLPAWGNRRVDEISKRDVLSLVDSIVDRGAPIKARRVFAHLHRFFGWCHGREIIQNNPMVGLSRPGSEISRERTLAEGELVQVWNGADKVPPFGQVVRLLLLTGARLNEIAQLKWSEVVGDTVHLEGARTKSGKPHLIPLSTPARTLLESLPRDAEYIFTVDGKRPVSGWSRAKAKLDVASGVKAWRLHDIRRTVATGMNELGVEPHIVEAALGHTVKGVAGVYNRAKYEAAKRSALEVWGAHVTALIEGRASGTVVPMRGTR